MSNPLSADAIYSGLCERIDAVDSMMGFERVEHGEKDGQKARKGWLINMHATTVRDPSERSFSAVDYYFLDEEGGSFKATYRYSPYLFVDVEEGHENEVEEWVRRKVDAVRKIEKRVKEDLAMPNHLIGLKKTLLQLFFDNVPDLLGARRVLGPIIAENQQKREARDMYKVMDHEAVTDAATFIVDMKEYDVPYHVRVSIDNGVRVGKWYDVYVKHSEVTLVEDTEKLAFADPVVLAYDIETTKAPLKFPNAQVDQIMMISYMIDGEGYLITNRDIIAEDIEDFEYTPRAEYPGVFTVFNEADERAVLARFFEHIREVRPTVMTTFNGDFFDWPFVETRARFHDMDMFDEIGFAQDNEGEYKSKYCVHMDCYRWVKRDSYLPQGSQGLKAVTTAKLGYNPTELDPELMTPYAYEKPQVLAEYSVSDAVATYYLYFKYVHPFIFSLCTIIPLNPDEVLRKGTGTLCEMLLSVKAYEGNILLPNKHREPVERFYDGHLLESETYVGGHVESLEAGVFRSDIPCEFKVDKKAVEEIMGTLDASMRFCVEVENKKNMDEVTNYNEVYEEIKKALEGLRDRPNRVEEPLIYHVDVASMYPNIMTSNRLQPDSMKSEEDCAACDFNRPGKTCDRRLPWSWRGEFLPAQMNEYGMIKRSLQNERFPGRFGKSVPFDELAYPQQAALVKKRLADYGKKVYHRLKQSQVVTREAIICQRENPFYVDTVRSFRDRRYEFKGLAKEWKGKVAKLDDPISKGEAKKMVVLYDSLQLAHKVILNSFYGYVMRKGSRWYSMEMAGVTCLTGATIIQMARGLVERLGRPLELDTDGIWCILPASFPENFKLKLRNGKSILLEYPCSMLNYLVHQQFTNHQYQTLEDQATLRYSTHSENSIFFEVDGPYKAMVLPTSKEEGKNLKKRYAVFNHDGTLAELKGFELKRRGELGLIKTFQRDIFKLFLEGNTLESCYGAVASVANNWLDVMETKGGSLNDEDLVELLCENRSMSKALAEYGAQKSTSITTARRLGEFLGEEMVKDAGLATKYIISAKPVGAPVTERAIPVSIFSSDKRDFFLKKWLRDPSLDKFSPRDVIDWAYYSERLASVVQKIISIPAALQNVPNPVPRVQHPDWLRRRIKEKEDKKQQKSIMGFVKSEGNIKAEFEKYEKEIGDIEDYGDAGAGVNKTRSSKVTSRKRKAEEKERENEEQALAVLHGPCPPMTDYGAFLEYQKAKWVVQARNRAQRKRLFGASAEASGRSSLGGMLRKQAETVAGSDWEVLEYRMGTDEVRVSALVGGRLHQFGVRMKRQVYGVYDTVPAKSSVSFEKSSAILPNSHDASNLYRITMDEEVFQKEVRRLGGPLQDPIGLYETQITPVERAIMDFGNTVRFDDTRVGALGRGLKNGFSARDLVQVQNKDYLKRFDMKVVYVLHVVTNGYEMYCVFSSWEASAVVYVLKPSNSAAELPKMGTIYSDAYTEKRNKLSGFEYPSEMAFSFEHLHSKEKTLKKLRKAVSDLCEGRKVIVAVQSPSNLDVRVDLPTIQMKVGEFSLPAVGWQKLIFRRVVNHYLSLGSWIEKMVSLARYSNVPLCNLRVDNIGHLIDIEYARRLAKNNVVLWWSPGPLPDHGGFEDDYTDTETFEFPVVNNPEVYEKACLEVEIRTLAINSILTSSLLNEAEGADLAEDGVHFDTNNGASMMADSAFSSPALSVLRTMVKDWWDDALKGNSHADTMMQSLVTWVQRKDSMLYDRALHRHVHVATTKAMLQLMGEFKRMNANIVYASRDKFVLHTSKAVENSYAYGQYLVRAARSKPLFNFLDLGIIRYWDLLVWMDEYNYGGCCCEEIREGEQDIQLVNHWHIQKFLPRAVEKEFLDYVVVYMDKIKEEKTVKNNQGKEEDSLDSFRRQLVKTVSRLYKLQNNTIIDPRSAEAYAFPVLPGSHLTMRNPTLELVKFLCAVFGLSAKRSAAVQLLRKELLAIFDVREFSPEATFRTPSASLKIPHVACDYCSHIRDIDVCRDEDIWTCVQCKKAYNRVLLEEELISQWYGVLARFYSQDYKCGKCGGVRDTNLSVFCKCSGEWVETVEWGSVEERWGVFGGVARWYRMEMLEGVVESTERTVAK